MQEKNGECIYRDGTYMANNPTLHSEDSQYKFGYINSLLENCNLVGPSIRVLDIGGGAGIIAARLCDKLASSGFVVECHSFDLSSDMLASQQANNPYVTLACSDFDQICKQNYDITLLVDVIEHVTENSELAKAINSISKYIVYNIPIEKNLFDFLRNLYFRGRYYDIQKKSLGHVHFYSFGSAKRFVRKHHNMLSYVVPDYPGYLLESDYTTYVKQRESRVRWLELVVSKFVLKNLNLIAPWVIQGSVFFLASARK